MADHDTPDALPVSALTWAALLARWTEFARASVAFPKDAPGDRWRSSVAPVIGLQATTFALAELDELAPDERALGLDRAGLLVRTHATDLHGVWRGEAMPETLREVVDDAQRALTLARERGVEYRVSAERIDAPDALAEIERAMQRGARIEFVLAAPPGTTLFQGEPALFVRGDTNAFEIDGLSRAPSAPRQIYRQPGRDVIALFDDALQPGTPLLRVVVDDGRVVRRFADSERPSRVDGAEVVEKPLDDDRL